MFGSSGVSSHVLKKRVVKWAHAWGRKGGVPLHPCEAENKLFPWLLSLWPPRPLGCGVLVVVELPVQPSLLSMPISHLPAGLSAILWNRKLSFAFISESYQPGKLFRTPTLIVLNSNEICHPQEKGMIILIALPETLLGLRTVTVGAAAVRRGRIADLLIFKLTPALMGFWFSLGTALKFLATKVYRTSHLLKFVLTSLPG